MNTEECQEVKQHILDFLNKLKTQGYDDITVAAGLLTIGTTLCAALSIPKEYIVKEVAETIDFYVKEMKR